LPVLLLFFKFQFIELLALPLGELAPKATERVSCRKTPSPPSVSTGHLPQRGRQVSAQHLRNSSRNWNLIDILWLNGVK